MAAVAAAGGNPPLPAAPPKSRFPRPRSERSFRVRAIAGRQSKRQVSVENSGVWRDVKRCESGSVRIAIRPGMGRRSRAEGGQNVGLGPRGAYVQGPPACLDTLISVAARETALVAVLDSSRGLRRCGCSASRLRNSDQHNRRQLSTSASATTRRAISTTSRHMRECPTSQHVRDSEDSSLVQGPELEGVAALCAHLVHAVIKSLLEPLARDVLSQRDSQI